MLPEIRILRRYARAWGVGTVIRASGHRHGSPAGWWRRGRYSGGPGDGSLLDYGSDHPIIVWSPTPNEYDWPFFLHELAHAINDKEPDDADELGPMLGFEYLSLQLLGLKPEHWHRFMSQYQMHDTQSFGEVFHEWGQAPAWWHRRKIASCCRQAKRKGWFDSVGLPTFRR